MFSDRTNEFQKNKDQIKLTIKRNGTYRTINRIVVKLSFNTLNLNLFNVGK